MIGASPLQPIAALMQAGRIADACAALAQLAPNAVPLDQRMQAAAEIARHAVSAGLTAQALTLTEPLAGRSAASQALLEAHAHVLKALGRLEDAIPFLERVAKSNSKSVAAEHNLGAALGDAQRFAEAEASIRRALAKGGASPETWLVLARALQGQDRFEEAEAAFAEVAARRPNYGVAQREWAQLIWMRTEDVGAATVHLDAALKAAPNDAGLLTAKAKLLEYAGDREGAFAMLRGPAGQAEASTELLVAASQVGASLDPAAAVSFAERAASTAGLGVGVPLAEAYLAAGRPDAAEYVAQACVNANPLDQGAWALLATAWRLLGDARYKALYDYQAFVRPALIDVPDGWSDRTSYVTDLAAALRALHAMKTHPIGQSLRHGSQTSQSLQRSNDPAIKAFRQAVDGPIRRYMAALGQGGDILRSRVADDWRFSGLWSVKLRPGGFHVDHTHPQGWLSSACYLALPESVGAGGKEGWIKFGQPGVATDPPLEAEHYVRPEPGLLALFPSYMWHGTVPFSGADERLTIAFDIVPA
ncbi:putative 2OG-Fe(II) oxygenase [Caulobacter sp. NIBR2454]|uniref:putative 2OG-Fe(II) oxygenase n=1 Tax=Caulobacter sp. NIBR2454 TaxID=3015996 RepID=UPI0022B5F726|nr:putative 2OG-Fe(II) oxygenase [Caulobacter sp. NIBR2454]